MNVARDLGADVLDILGAGVILGNHDSVGILASGDAHRGASIDTLTARSAKYNRQLALGIVLAQVAQECLEAHAVMCKIDDAQDFARYGRIELHTTGNEDALKAMDDTLFGNAQGLGAGNSGKRVGHIELNRRGNHNVTRKTGRAHRCHHAAVAIANRQRKHVGTLVGQGERHRTFATRCRLEHAIDLIHIEIDHGKTALQEDFELAGKVILERRMLNRRNVILADIGKGADFKVNLARTLVFEALTRCLHNQPRGTRLRSMRDARLQQEGFGGRQLGRARLDAVVELNARIKSGSMTARKLGLVGEDAAQIKAAGRLALGACKGADLHLTRRVPIKGICHHGERATNIAHNHRGKINIVIDLGNVGHGAIGDCRKQVLALKRTAFADKQRARTHLARVISRKLNALVARSARSGNNKAIFLEQLYIAHQS